jgi:hypothetical protein
MRKKKRKMAKQLKTIKEQAKKEAAKLRKKVMENANLRRRINNGSIPRSLGKVKKKSVYKSTSNLEENRLEAGNIGEVHKEGSKEEEK